MEVGYRSITPLRFAGIVALAIAASACQPDIMMSEALAVPETAFAAHPPTTEWGQDIAPTTEWGQDIGGQDIGGQDIGGQDTGAAVFGVEEPLGTIYGTSDGE